MVEFTDLMYVLCSFLVFISSTITLFAAWYFGAKLTFDMYTITLIATAFGPITIVAATLIIILSAITYVIVKTGKLLKAL